MWNQKRKWWGQGKGPSFPFYYTIRDPRWWERRWNFEFPKDHGKPPKPPKIGETTVVTNILFIFFRVKNFSLKTKQFKTQNIAKKKKGNAKATSIIGIIFETR